MYPSRAGHLPPLLALPDGSTRVPEVPAGPSLGLGTCAYGQARIKLAPGTILALYTDGLVETRTCPYDQGVLALRTVLGGERGDLETACDTVIRALGGAREDDITMVLARVQPLSICRNSRVLPKAPSERLKSGRDVEP
jgi:serine phosphatase RsbU (regulator of sigma subunit)